MDKTRFTNFGASAALGVLLWLVVPSQVDAQVMLSPAFDEKAETDSTPQHLSVILRPQMPPDPMLRYRLWPAAEDRRPRSAMTAVNRALILVAQVSPSNKREFLEQYDGWMDLSVDQIPVEEAKLKILPFENAISVLRSGENWMELTYDLGLQEMSVGEKLGTLLPEFQEMRDLARILTLRARVAAAQHRWNDAIDDLRLGFRLSEVAAHSTDTLLGRLVGTAIGEVMFDTVEAMIQQPGCPNLYWALAALPIDHLYEIRESIEYEIATVHHLGAIAGLDELPDTMIGSRRAQGRIKAIADSFSTMFEPIGSFAGDESLRKMAMGVQVALMVEPCRTLLREDPEWGPRIDELSDAEIVLRASNFELQRIRDRVQSWTLLPSELWSVASEQREKGMQVPRHSVTLGGDLSRMLFPAAERASQVEQNIKQKHHRLITLEALRIHAAKTGTLPTELDGSLAVPAWHDPLTRAPFRYIKFSESEAALTRSDSGRNSDQLTTKITLEKN